MRSSSYAAGPLSAKSIEWRRFDCGVLRSVRVPWPALAGGSNEDVQVRSRITTCYDEPSYAAGSEPNNPNRPDRNTDFRIDQARALVRGGRRSPTVAGE
jgi:hypothetical protein